MRHPSSILSSSRTLSSNFLILCTLFGDMSRATASVCADLVSSPTSLYTLASWNTTFDSSGAVFLRYSKSSIAACTHDTPIELSRRNRTYHIYSPHIYATRPVSWLADNEPVRYQGPGEQHHGRVTMHRSDLRAVPLPVNQVTGICQF